jgi:hypothetical protein
MAVGGFIKAGPIADRTANPVEGQIYFALDTGAEGATRYNGQEWEELYASPAGGGAHDHDTDYAPLVHNHDTSYAPLIHNHDAAYAPLIHNHDAAYSPIGHDHNGVYASLAGANTYSSSAQNFIGLNILGATENVSTWARGIFFTDLSGDSATRRGGLGVYGTAAATQRLWLTLADGTSPWSSIYGIHMLPLGLVGIGTTTPSVRLHIAAGGILNSGTAPAATALLRIAGAASALTAPVTFQHVLNDAPSGSRGIEVEPDFYPVSGATTMYNILSIPNVRGANNLASMMAGYFRVDLDSYSGVLTNAYGLYVANPTVTGTGSMTNLYGLYIADQNYGTGQNWSLYVAGANAPAFFACEVSINNTLTVTANMTLTGTISTNHSGAATAATITTRTERVFSTGTPAASFGLRRETKLESDTTADRDAAYDDVYWTTATDASRASARRWYLSRAGVMTEGFRVDMTDNASNTNVVLLFNGVLKRIGVGAADSGGAGYRMLRIPN